MKEIHDSILEKVSGGSAVTDNKEIKAGMVNPASNISDEQADKSCGGMTGAAASNGNPSDNRIKIWDIAVKTK